MKKIILASTSPRRRDILKETGIQFEIINPFFEENIQNKSFSNKLVEDTARNKAITASKRLDKNSIILSADTVVVYDNIILGKPKDYDDAIRMLKMLSGNTHKVVTAVCIMDNESGIIDLKTEISEVTFNEIDSERIKEYVQNFRPYDKAGGYGIQELSEDFVKEIKGDYTNIVGLPINTVKNMLKEIGL